MNASEAFNCGSGAVTVLSQRLIQRLTVIVDGKKG